MKPTVFIAALLAAGIAHAADAPKKPREKSPQAAKPHVAPQDEHRQPMQSSPADAHITGMPATFVIPKNTCESGKTLETLRSNLLKKP